MQLNSIGNEILNDTGFQSLQKTAKSLIDEEKTGGRNLSSILIHKNTHYDQTKIKSIDDYRVHHGRENAKTVTKDMMNHGLKFIKNGRKIWLNYSDIDEYRTMLNNEPEILKEKKESLEVKTHEASSHLKITQLNKAIDEIYEGNKKIYKSF